MSVLRQLADERMAFHGAGTRADDLERLLKWLQIVGVDVEHLEHAVEPGLRLHTHWLTVPPYTVAPRLVMVHPEHCGCNALPDHVLLEG